MTFFKSSCLAIGILLLSCNAKTDQDQKAIPANPQEATAVATQKEIMVYGSNTCDHCIDFRAQLDSAGLAYIFKDVEVNEFLANELMAKIQAINYQGNVSFPVIDVNGKVMVAPKLKEVMAEL